jgi:general secretion pathway protein L
MHDRAMIEPVTESKARRLYTWWIGELSKALTPRRAGTRPWRILLLSTSSGLGVHAKTAAGSSLLGTLAAGANAFQTAGLQKAIAKSAETNSKDVVLRLSDTEVVERTIQVPKAASDVIDPIVHNQLERIVPWPEAETRYGYRIVGPNAKAPAQLDVRIIATSRGILDGALAKARSLGLEPIAVDFAPPSTPDDTVELMSLAPDPTKRTAELLQLGLAAALIVSVAISAFGFFDVWQRQAQRDDVAEKVAMVRSRVERNARLNIQNNELKKQHRRLIGQKADEPAIMMLIERLSGTLPDSAYLTELEIHGRDTRIVGRSDNSTALINVLEETKEFEDVRFAAPTTREEGESAETFSIVAKVHGVPDAEKRP